MDTRFDSIFGLGGYLLIWGLGTLNDLGDVGTGVYLRAIFAEKLSDLLFRGVENCFLGCNMGNIVA